MFKGKKRVPFTVAVIACKKRYFVTKEVGGRNITLEQREAGYVD